MYNTYWKLFEKLVGSSVIRPDERNFFQRSINKIKKRKLTLDVLVDLGCGDGRISASIYDIVKFKKIILVDKSNSVYIARKRVRHLSTEVFSFKTSDPFSVNEIMYSDVLICIGLINYFKNQAQVVEKILGQSSQVIFISVTGYTTMGLIYKFLNLIRINFFRKIISKFLKYLYRVFNFNSNNKHGKTLFMLMLRFMEPIVSPRIYWLPKKQYETLFTSNGYQIVDSGNFGFSQWYCLLKVK